MIRPVLYVDLPGIIYSMDSRARSKEHEFANFICWPEPIESRVPLLPLLRNIFPLSPASRTWICEDHWRILGFAQVRERPSHTMWDLTYLASMAQRNVPNDDVVTALLEYILEMASMHGILRVFARVQDEIPELDLFHRIGFQGFARELTFVRMSGSIQVENTLPSLRRWNRHHVWGLHQLYRAVTPHRVQMAELLESSEEFAKLNVGSLTPLPGLLSHGTENYISDLGVRLGGWLRIRRGTGSAPHQLAIMVHPEHTELAEPLLQFGLSRLANGPEHPVYCQVREYETGVITALSNSGFEHTSTRVVLVRHMALLAVRPRTVPALEQRVVYGVKGLGTVNSRQTMR